MTTIGGGIAVAGFFIGAAYVAGTVVKSLAKRGSGKDEARTEAIVEGLRSGQLEANDVNRILATFDNGKISEDDDGPRLRSLADLGENGRRSDSD